LRLSRAIRSAAWALVVTGTAAPLLRRRADLRKAPVLAAAVAAPAALCVAAPRGRLRDGAVCALQMWAYLAAYEMPNDDPQALRERVHIDYPIRIDRALGLGRIPTERLQRALARAGEINRVERALIWSHWAWFVVPHLAVGYVGLRRPATLGTAAARMYAVYDLGAAAYWLLPTAPPWWAAAHGRIEELEHRMVRNGVHVPGQAGANPAGARHLPVRRMMLEYGERFWGPRWNDIYETLGGNPLAAMPSLHFATSVMAARLLWEVDPVAGAAGCLYAGTLAVALVYLGEHYVVDVIAGGLLAQAVHRSAEPLTPAVHTITRALRRLRALAEAD